MGYDLSVLIPGRNEEFFAKTIENVLENIEGNTEIIAVCDGNWPDPSVPDDPRVTLIHHEAIGQRQATNEAARLSQAKYIMKLDAHCAVDKGFDVKLIAEGDRLGQDVTQVMRMYNLHAFDWVCPKCKERTYQGPTPKSCTKCDGQPEKEIVWKPRESRVADFMRFDSNMKFQYWRTYGKRREAKAPIADQMCAIGACWFMERKRYWDLGGLDEKHGSWGQMGVEIACKSWLSGGRQVVNKLTWFAHMFRTQGGDFSFPYPLSRKETDAARKHSRKLWQGNNWPQQQHDLMWLVNKFGPVPDWHDNPTYELVYYTDNRPEDHIFLTCQKQLNKCMDLWGYPIISVSQKPIDFGRNIVMDIERSVLSMYRQILTGLEASTADNIFMIEHDLLYHPNHFDFTPPKNNVYYYDRNRWCVCADTGKAVFYHSNVPSLLCANRQFLVKHFRKKVEFVGEHGHKGKYGFSPPRGLPPELREGKYKTWMAEHPCIDIRHTRSLTRRRMTKEEFRSPRSRRGWTEAEEVPGWGKTFGRFNEFLEEL